MEFIVEMKAKRRNDKSGIFMEDRLTDFFSFQNLWRRIIPIEKMTNSITAKLSVSLPPLIHGTKK